MNIQTLFKELSTLDCLYPRLFASLFFGGAQNNQRSLLFKAMRIWTEIVEIFDNECFSKLLFEFKSHLQYCLVDGSSSVVEHIVHVVFLPSLHSTGRNHQRGRSPPSDSSLYSHALTSTIPSASIKPGWNPFHFRVRVTTRLFFNDAGRVVYHRDLIDLKDLIQGFPGGTAFQWLASTIAAQSLSLISRFLVRRPKESRDTHSAPAVSRPGRDPNTDVG
jgi:hypothetical protein